MKRILCLIIAVFLCLSVLASCNKSNSDIGNTANTDANTNANTDTSSNTNANTNTSTPSPSTSFSAEQPDIPATPVEEGLKYAEELDCIINNAQIVAVNPLAAGGNAGSSTVWVYKMIYEVLIVRVGENEYEPRLATSWVTEDYKTYTFKLRDDVTFHNGDKFTANDVVWTVHAGQEAVGTTTFETWNEVESVTADDDYTVTFVLKTVNVEFLFNVSQPWASILNERATTADPEKGVWVGTGAWTITDFNTNDYVKLARNDNYWGEKALTQRLTLRFVPEESARLMMLLNGETDVCFALHPDDYAVVENDPDYDLYTVIYCSFNMLGFNMNDSITGDLNFRKAVASALNRDEITLIARGNYGIPESTGTYWGQSTEFRNNDIPIIPYDLDKAREYLEASSYNGETVEIAAAINTNIYAAAVIQQELALIGINTEVNQMDPVGLSSHASYTDNRSQIIVFAGAAAENAYSIRNHFYPGTAVNRASYNNPEVTALFDLAPTVTDVNERRDLYMKIQEIVAEDIPYQNLFWLVNATVCTKGVGGIELTANTFFDLNYIYKIID